MPARSVALELDGGLYFATRSPVWGGGRAFYDPFAHGRRVLVRAYLVSVEQFSDIAAQEMYREPGGAPLDLGEVLVSGRVVLGPGRYETLVCAGQVEGVPVLTFTAPWGIGDVASAAPSAAYLRFLVAGLLSAGTWDLEAVTSYLAACPGAAGHWSPGAIAALVRDGHAPAE